MNDVNLKELENFGFKPKYDEDTGKINAYVKHIKETEHEGLFIKLEKSKSKIRIFRRSDTDWRINAYQDRFDIDTLFDLIQAGLVEKIEE